MYHGGIIIESDKNITPAEIANLEECLPECLDYGVEIQNQKTKHGGKDKKPGPDIF
jgi:hypothetical protein